MSIKYEKGAYHWSYELSLLKNPTILKMLWKIFFWVIFGVWAFICVVDLFDGNMTWRNWVNMSQTFIVLVLGFEILVALGYFVYAMIVGFKYCVDFTMDERGVVHKQQTRQYRKIKSILCQPKMIVRQSMSSTWNAVRSVEIIRRHEVIKVNETLNKNQVYVPQDDFDFVKNFILAHVPTDCKVYEK